MGNTKADSLQRLIIKARDETATGATLRDVLRYAIAGYLIGSLKYSDDQPRDDSGRWSDTGGGGSSGGGSGDGSHASMDAVLGDASTDMRIYSDLNDSPNKEAIGKAVAKHLKETSGAEVSSKEGFEMAQAVHQYAGNDNYRKIRNGEMPETAKQLDNLVSKSAPYQGNIYRGMSFGDDFFKNDLYPGATFDTRGVSSWSSDKKHADMFANRKQYGVLLSVKNKSGASIAFLSKDEKEQEVLNPSTARYRVKSVKIKQLGTKEIYHVQLEEE